MIKRFGVNVYTMSAVSILLSFSVLCQLQLNIFNRLVLKSTFDELERTLHCPKALEVAETGDSDNRDFSLARRVWKQLLRDESIIQRARSCNEGKFRTMNIYSVFWRKKRKRFSQSNVLQILSPFHPIRWTRRDLPSPSLLTLNWACWIPSWVL